MVKATTKNGKVADGPAPAASEAAAAMARRRWAKVPKGERTRLARRAGLGNRKRKKREMSETNRANAKKAPKRTPEELAARGKAIAAGWERRRKMLARKVRGKRPAKP